MRYFINSLLLIGLGLIAHAYWGIFTRSGSRFYDEMAGIVPVFGGFIGAACLVLGGILEGVRRWRKRCRA
jgi:sorbitol-specific phosphotransferase system component IIC